MRFACYPIVMRCLKNPDDGHRPDQEIDAIHEFRFSDAGASEQMVHRSHMEKAFTQRREQVIGDCLQLQNDVDAYNAMNPGEKPIQLVLDFTDDVAEKRAA
jgi:hypothetical protein